MGTFNDLQMKVTSDFALQTLHKKLTPVIDFAHNFRDLEGRIGEAIVVPNFTLSAAKDFDSSTNNYFSGEKEVTGETVNLSSHIMKSCMYTDRDVVETDCQFQRDYGIGIGDTIGRSIYNKVIGQLTEAGVTLSATLTNSSKAGFADLVATTYDKDLDIGQTVVMLDPTNYAKLLGFLDANVYGSTAAIQAGRIEGLYGFKSVVCATGLPNGWKGALVDCNSIAVATRYLAPMPGAYVNAWKGSDPVSGLTIGFREGVNLATGYRYLCGEVLMGAKIIRTNGIVKLK